MGQAVPEWAERGMVWRQLSSCRSCTLIATVFPSAVSRPPERKRTGKGPRPAGLASPWDNSRSDKHLNGLSMGDAHSNSKRLESRACENCDGNLEDELLYNRRISVCPPQKQKKGKQRH